MAWTNYQILLALVMVITGSINTLSTKWADEIESAGRDGDVHVFDHPFFQASCMFIGEMLCLVVFKILYKVYSLRAVSSFNSHQSLSHACLGRLRGREGVDAGQPQLQPLRPVAAGDVRHDGHLHHVHRSKLDLRL
jgi:hypothetical protein